MPRSTSTTRLTRLARQRFRADIGHRKHYPAQANPSVIHGATANAFASLQNVTDQSPETVSSGVSSPSLYIPTGHPFRDNGIITPNNSAPPSPTNELPGAPLNLASPSTSPLSTPTPTSSPIQLDTVSFPTPESSASSSESSSPRPASPTDFLSTLDTSTDSLQVTLDNAQESAELIQKLNNLREELEAQARHNGETKTKAEAITLCQEIEELLEDPTPTYLELGKYILIPTVSDSSLYTLYRAFHRDTHKEYVCKVSQLIFFSTSAINYKTLFASRDDCICRSYAHSKS